MSDADRAEAAESSSTLTPQLIRENAFLRRRTTWSLVTARAGAAAGNGGAFAGLMKAIKSGGAAKLPAATAAADTSTAVDAVAPRTDSLSLQGAPGATPAPTAAEDEAAAAASDGDSVSPQKQIPASNAGLVEGEDGSWWGQVEEVVLEHRQGLTIVHFSAQPEPFLT